MTEARTLSDHRPLVVGSAAFEAFRNSFRGPIVLPDAREYEEARRIWNAMIDRRPGAIARCANASDVIEAVRLAREDRLLVAVRAGGHNIAGNAICDDGLVIDLSSMRSVEIDQFHRTARVGPGATLGDFDRAAQAFALAVPLGINSTTGVAGLTLGGGFGWLSRKYGLTVDSLTAVDLVTADGRRRRATKDEHADLFWAIRGGGGNFGVVTSFEFELHPVGPQLLSGLIVHAAANSRGILEAYRGFMAEAPDELMCMVVLRKAPPLPFLPEAVHGEDVLVFAVCWAGAIEEGRRALEPLRRIGQPVADVIDLQAYADWQAAFDQLLAPGARNYWKSHCFAELGNAALDVILAYATRLPTPECEIFIVPLGGAMKRVPVDDTAYPHREAEFVLNVHARWRDPRQDEACIGWAREFFAKAAPHATGGVYVNFMPEDESDRVRAAFGPNFDRLAMTKAKYDPGNLFRINQNVQPAAP
jgi:FAD binding domain/Berberine and berberine like